MLTLNEFRRLFDDLRLVACRNVACDEDGLIVSVQLENLRHSCERLAAYDTFEGVLNRRGGEWYAHRLTPTCVVKIDFYDAKGANSRYGRDVVDNAFRSLAAQLVELFPSHPGEYVRHSAGSDEFFVYTATRVPAEVEAGIRALSDREPPLSVPWDFGVGLTEEEAEINLQVQRRKYRPGIVRVRFAAEELGDGANFSSISPPSKVEDVLRLFSEFQATVETRVPNSVRHKIFQSIDIVRDRTVVEVSSDPLTGLLDFADFGRFALDGTQQPKAFAHTDIEDLHEANLVYGATTVDQGLRRLASGLTHEFPAQDGYRVFRGFRGGDEFMITSLVATVAELRTKLSNYHQVDENHARLAWRFGVGCSPSAARQDLSRLCLADHDDLPAGNEFGEMDHIVYMVVRLEEPDVTRLRDYTARLTHECCGKALEDYHCSLFRFEGVNRVNDFKPGIDNVLRNLHLELRLTRLDRAAWGGTTNHIWLMVEKTPELRLFYESMLRLSSAFGVRGAYSFAHWKPHVTLLHCAESSEPFVKRPIWGEYPRLAIPVESFELTRRTRRGFTTLNRTAGFSGA
jgi:GGDEF domain-containing protein